MSNLAFDPSTERARYESRSSLLARQAALRLDLAKGITFQPETADSVADQVRETLWAEGKTPESCGSDERAEVEASFEALAPRREPDGLSLVATLFLGFPDDIRDRKMRALRGLPEQLVLELSNGKYVDPVVDRGAARPEDRLPAVLALRYLVPDGVRPAALVCHHPEVPGRWEAPAAWSSWPF
jgi:hypothetical protein